MVIVREATSVMERKRMRERRDGGGMEGSGQVSQEYG
jgi:hypothetical protein